MSAPKVVVIFTPLVPRRGARPLFGRALQDLAPILLPEPYIRVWWQGLSLLLLLLWLLGLAVATVGALPFWGVGVLGFFGV